MLFAKLYKCNAAVKTFLNDIVKSSLAKPVAISDSI